MLFPKKEDYTFYQGNKLLVEFYYTKTGEMPAKSYFDKESIDLQVKLAALVKYIADHGRLFNVTKFRITDEKNKIFEFKPTKHRFFCFFFRRGKIIITNAYMKQSQKVSKKDQTKQLL